MSQRIITITIFLFIIIGGIVGLEYTALLPQFSLKFFNLSTPPLVGTTPTINSDLTQVVPIRIEKVISNLYVPWSIVFTSDRRFMFTERNGNIRQVVDGQLRNSPLITFPEVSKTSEEGLMGMALDPNYKSNQLFYAAYAYKRDGEMFDKVIQLKDEGDLATFQRILIDHIPAAQFHAGMRLRFGPDKKLYITTGDATEKSLAQQMSSLAGKILRLNSDGSIPPDNPFPNSPIYSLGHRNPQGIDWSPTTGSLWSTEHGPSLFDGPAGGDEVNRIEKGENYGWPIVSHEKTKDQLKKGELVFTPAVAPGSGMFYSASTLPQFKNALLFGMLKGEGIMVIYFNEGTDEIKHFEKIKEVNLGRIREITQSPDGLIYFSTSNQDGRGKPREGDDAIYRIVPSN